jgi:hypothetical protein
VQQIIEPLRGIADDREPLPAVVPIWIVEADGVISDIAIKIQRLRISELCKRHSCRHRCPVRGHEPSITRCIVPCTKVFSARQAGTTGLCVPLLSVELVMVVWSGGWPTLRRSVNTTTTVVAPPIALFDGWEARTSISLRHAHFEFGFLLFVD